MSEMDPAPFYQCCVCDENILCADFKNHRCFDLSGNSNHTEKTNKLIKNLHWPRFAVLKLIDIWKQNEKNFTSEKSRAKPLWQKIAAELATEEFNPTWERVENKWKGLRRTYKKIKDNNNSTGRANQCWEFFEQLDEIFAKRPDFVPESRASTTKGFQSTLASSLEENEETEPIPKRRAPQKTSF